MKITNEQLLEIIKEELENISEEPLEEQQFDAKTGKALTPQAELRLMKIDSDIMEYSLKQIQENARRFFGLKGVKPRLSDETAEKIDQFIPKLAAALRAMDEFHKFIQSLEK